MDYTIQCVFGLCIWKMYFVLCNWVEYVFSHSTL